jgi:hypothetical protein
VSEFDTPWKEALDRFLRAFLEFFFPHIHQAIDWTRGYEVLDNELQQIVREAESGRRVADKLFKVWRRDGLETWVLIHVEIQSQAAEDFAERMYVYHYRIFDRFRHPVVSLAVLGDDDPTWRPNSFRYELWGCNLTLHFPVAKLLDYAERSEELERYSNPFGLIVLAHLQSQATRDNPGDRCAWKIRLVKSLLDRGLTAEEIRQLFTLIDWLLDLPRSLEERFAFEILQYEKEKQMPYVTSIERLALDKGRMEGQQEGREEGRHEGLREGLLRGIRIGLEKRFAAEGQQLAGVISQIADVNSLQAIQDALWTAGSLADIRALLPEDIRQPGDS